MKVECQGSNLFRMTYVNLWKAVWDIWKSLFPIVGVLYNENAIYSLPQKKVYNFAEPSTQNWGGSHAAHPYKFLMV